MFSYTWLASLLFSSLLLSPVYAKSSSGDSVLAVIDPSIQKKYSIFFDGLKENGYEITFRAPKDEKPVVIEHDVAAFNHVILFTPDTKNLAKDLSPQNLVELTRKNTNLLLVVPNKQTFLTSLAGEFGIILPPPGTPLISYFPERREPATLIPIQASASSPVLSKDLPPVWFSGVGFALGSNPLLFPILNAPAESFAADGASDSGADALVEASEKGGEGLWAGSGLAVAAGFQTLGDARVAWVGGLELFSDELAKKEISKGVKSGNAQAAKDIAAWAFRETNVYRIDKTTHNLVNASSAIEPDHYTTNDQAVFTADITKYDPKTGQWVPYSGLEDLQLEFTMLDPHIRTALRPVPSKTGRYEVQFRVPDRHGVFKFIINYKRKGFSQLFSSTTVPVVPPRHDGYPRFLSAAWPYYTGAISTSVAFFLFSALWLAGEASQKRAGPKSQKVE